MPYSMHAIATVLYQPYSCDGLEVIGRHSPRGSRVEIRREKRRPLASRRASGSGVVPRRQPPPLACGWCEHLQLDVIGIPEHEHRAVRAIGNRRLGAGTIRGRGLLYAHLLEMGLPRFQVGAAWNRKPEVVEAGARFLEPLTLVVIVSMQHDDHLPRIISEELSCPSSVSFFHLIRDSKHLLVPGDAGIEIRDCEGDMMQTGARHVSHAELLPIHAIRFVRCRGAIDER